MRAKNFLLSLNNHRKSPELKFKKKFSRSLHTARIGPRIRSIRDEELSYCETDETGEEEEYED